MTGSAAAPAARCRNCLRWGSFIMCPSMSFGDEISRIGSQNYTDFRCSRKGAGGDSWPTGEESSSPRQVRSLGYCGRGFPEAGGDLSRRREWAHHERSSAPIQDFLQPLRRDGQLRDCAWYTDRVFDRISDGGADGRDTALAGALDAERIEVGREVLSEDDFQAGDFPRGRHQIVREGHGQWVAALAVAEFFQQRAA